MHETSAPQPHEATPGHVALRFMTMASLGLEPERLDFYQLLLSCTGKDAAQEKIRHALRFCMEGYGRASFIASLDALPAPLLQFPLWRIELEALPGEQARASLLDSVQCMLGQAPAAFLASAGWKGAQADVWQSLLALALTQADHLSGAALSLQLTDVLRIGHFLRLLDSGATSLEASATRRAALTAQLVLPDAVMLPR
jgi:hypothetical protein